MEHGRNVASPPISELVRDYIFAFAVAKNVILVDRQRTRDDEALEVGSMQRHTEYTEHRGAL